MRPLLRQSVCLSLCIVLAGCAELPEESEALEGREQAIVYGSDDRLEVYEHPSAALRDVASSAIVALILRSRFVRTSSGVYELRMQSLAEAFDVCPDARFAQQPTLADCSGVLIDDDLVLTAGHCVADDQACARYAFVFDYFYARPGVLEPPGWGSVYGCRRLVHRSFSQQSAAVRVDYAVVQLDRKVVGRTPARLRATPATLGEPLATLGFASGLPAKIDSGGRVLAARPELDYFLLDSDTFAGSSGSGVFDAEAQLVGVLVRGGTDYERRPGGSCVVPKVVRVPGDGPLVGGVGEEATYVGRAVEGLCGVGWPSQRLCATAPRCGDGFCTGDEARASCPADCACPGRGCVGARVEASAGGPGAIAKHRDPRGCALVTPARGQQDLAWFASFAVLLLIALARRRTHASTRDERRIGARR